MSDFDEADAAFYRDKRRNRWDALHEDERVFGLVPAEVAELARLDQEFGPWSAERATG